jgi:hypothetical protein
MTRGGRRPRPKKPALDDPARAALRRKWLIVMATTVLCLAGIGTMVLLSFWPELTGVRVEGTVLRIDGSEATIRYQWDGRTYQDVVGINVADDGSTDVDTGPAEIIVDPTMPTRAVLPGQAPADLSVAASLLFFSALVFVMFEFQVPLVLGSIWLTFRSNMRKTTWAEARVVVDDGVTMQDLRHRWFHTAPTFTIVTPDHRREVVSVLFPIPARRWRLMWPDGDVRLEVLTDRGPTVLLRPPGAAVLLRVGHRARADRRRSRRERRRQDQSAASTAAMTSAVTDSASRSPSITTS